MENSRRQARILAVKALAQWDVQKDPASTNLSALWRAEDDDAGDATIPPQVLSYARTLLEAFWQRRQAVDDRISAAATNWALDRISTVERNAMRVAVVELLEGEVPPRVAIDEAIEIGREYGGKDSPRFINGVLDVVHKRLEQRRKVSG